MLTLDYRNPPVHAGLGFVASSHDSHFALLSGSNANKRWVQWQGSEWILILQTGEFSEHVIVLPCCHSEYCELAADFQARY
jgi:hypothetical protein